MKAVDLTGRRFGKLTVLGLDAEPYRSPSGKVTRRWHCRCDCGTDIVVINNALTSGDTRSCGCARREAMRRIGHDLSGKRFGRLTVIREVDLEKPEKNGNTRGWLCRCDCGTEIVATQKALELSGLKSCGCLLRDTAKGKILESNTVGHYKGTTVSAIRPERRLNSNNKSGVKGVYWSNREGAWIAKIGFQGRTITIGRYQRLDDAAKARKAAEEKYFSPVIEEYDRGREDNDD